jgi:hypothetical protein
VLLGVLYFKGAGFPKGSQNLFNGTLPKGSRVLSTLFKNAHWIGGIPLGSILPIQHAILHISKIAGHPGWRSV